MIELLHSILVEDGKMGGESEVMLGEEVAIMDWERDPEKIRRRAAAQRRTRV